MATINVTSEDISRGEPKNARCCPVAIAIGRHANWATEVTVDRYEIGFETDINCESELVSTPAEASEFIKDFDAGMPVQPFSFNLDIPEGF